MNKNELDAIISNLLNEDKIYDRSDIIQRFSVQYSHDQIDRIIGRYSYRIKKEKQQQKKEDTQESLPLKIICRNQDVME